MKRKAKGTLRGGNKEVRGRGSKEGGFKRTAEMNELRSEMNIVMYNLYYFV